MTSRRTYRRSSDRWVTPGVVIAGIVVAGLVVLGVAALVALLAVRGIDPGPVVQLAGSAAGAVTGLATVALQLVQRKTSTKTERSAGKLAAAVAGQLVEVRPARTTGALPAVPPPVPANNRRGELAPRGGTDAVPSEQTGGRDQVQRDRLDAAGRHRLPPHMEHGNGPDAAGEASNRAR